MGHVGGALLGEEAGDLGLRAAHARERRDERPGARAVEPAHHHRHELEARLGDEPALELCRLPVEPHVVPAVAQLLGQGERRVDVSRRPARRDGDLEVFACHVSPSVRWCSQLGAAARGALPPPAPAASAPQALARAGTEVNAPPAVGVGGGAPARRRARARGTTGTSGAARRLAAGGLRAHARGLDRSPP